MKSIKKRKNNVTNETSISSSSCHSEMFLHCVSLFHRITPNKFGFCFCWCRICFYVSKFPPPLQKVSRGLRNICTWSKMDSGCDPKLLEVLEVKHAILVTDTKSLNIPSFLAITPNASLLSPKPEMILAERSEPGKSLCMLYTPNFSGNLAAIFCSLWAFPVPWCLSTFLYCIEQDDGCYLQLCGAGRDCNGEELIKGKWKQLESLPTPSCSAILFLLLLLLCDFIRGFGVDCRFKSKGLCHVQWNAETCFVRIHFLMWISQWLHACQGCDTIPEGCTSSCTHMFRSPQDIQDHQITEFLRLEKITKNILSNHHPPHP